MDQYTWTGSTNVCWCLKSLCIIWNHQGLTCWCTPIIPTPWRKGQEDRRTTADWRLRQASVRNSLARWTSARLWLYTRSSSNRVLGSLRPFTCTYCALCKLLGAALAQNLVDSCCNPSLSTKEENHLNLTPCNQTPLPLNPTEKAPDDSKPWKALSPMGPLLSALLVRTFGPGL